MNACHKTCDFLQIARLQIVEIKLATRTKALHQHAITGSRSASIAIQRARRASALLKRAQRSILIRDLLRVERLGNTIHAQHETLTCAAFAENVILVMFAFSQRLNRQTRIRTQPQCIAQYSVVTQVAHYFFVVFTCHIV